jgi:hypothetical protein
VNHSRALLRCSALGSLNRGDADLIIDEKTCIVVRSAQQLLTKTNGKVLQSVVCHFKTGRVFTHAHAQFAFAETCLCGLLNIAAKYESAHLIIVWDSLDAAEAMATPEWHSVQMTIGRAMYFAAFH